jgi:hypothetical protein
LTYFSLVQENVFTMRQFSACLAVVAMLCALVSAPLFHLHEDDDHGHPGSLVHAHFPEPEQESPQSGVELEASHSHEHVRWLDSVFTVSSPLSAGVHSVAELSQPFLLTFLTVIRALPSVQTVYAHSPPERTGLVPRSPPAI